MKDYDVDDDNDDDDDSEEDGGRSMSTVWAVSRNKVSYFTPFKL